MTLALMLLGVVVCVALSGFFSGSEMAFSSCNRLRLENDAEDGNKKASLALYVASHFDDALSAILIGNNLVNVASSTLATSLILLFGLDDYAWAATLAVTLAEDRA